MDYCLGGDCPGENPGQKWTEQLTECKKKKKRRIVHRQELRKLEVQQQKLNAERGEGDGIKFDLGDKTTFDVEECPVGQYLEGKTFEEIYNILTKKELQKDLPVCKKPDGKPDPACIEVLHQTIVWKDVCKISNVKICSHEHVLKHSDTNPALTKNSCLKGRNLFLIVLRISTISGLIKEKEFYIPFLKCTRTVKLQELTKLQSNIGI